MIISYAQNFEDVMLWRALKHLGKGFYIDVGANDPSIDSVTKMFYEHGWCGINIEPLEFHFLALQRERSRDINLRCAVGSSDGDIEIWECDVRGWASVDKDVIDEHIAQGNTGSYSRVSMTTLSAICERHATSDIHYLKIDVEGFERAVLEGLDLERYRPWIVVVEATRPHSTEEVHELWESLLTESNYRFVYADGLNRFYLAHEHAELAISFKYPPNFFDEFVKAPLIEDNVWAETIVKRAAISEAKAAQAEAKAAQAEAKAAQAEAKAAHLEATIAWTEDRAVLAETRATLLLSSVSWRITAPIRRVVDFGNNFGPNVWKSCIRVVLHWAVKAALSQPGLARAGVAILGPFPRLKLHLKVLMAGNFASSGSAANAVQEMPQLSPRAHEIYTSLKAATAKIKKDRG
jgi:FkbM family methyltransferase